MPYFPMPGLVGLAQVLKLPVAWNQRAQRDQAAFGDGIGKGERRVKVGEGAVD